jgi:hypothetical protein
MVADQSIHFHHQPAVVETSFQDSSSESARSDIKELSQQRFIFVTSRALFSKESFSGVARFKLAEPFSSSNVYLRT